MTAPAPAGGFDLSTAKPVADSAPASGGGFDLSTATPVNSADAPPETASRVGGLGERALIQGLGHLADVPGALISLADRAGLSLHNYTRHLFGLKDDADAPPAAEAPHIGSDVTTKVSNAFGLPTPATPTERVISSAVESLPSAALVPEAPILGAVSAGLGGAASQGAKELGVGPVGQAVAGLAAGSVPAIGTAAAGLTRTLARGAGSDAAAAMNARMTDAANAGTALTAGQAGGSRVVQAVENTSGRLWGGGSIAANAEKQTGQLESSVNNIVDNLNPKGAAMTPMGAGESISKGVAETKISMRDAERAAYDKVDTLVPETAPMNVSASAQKAADLAAPTTNEALNAASVSPKIKAINEALAAYPDGNMPYADLTRLRTHVGGMIDRGFAPADPATNGAMKQLYGTLTDDMGAGAGAVSPEAQDAVKAAGSLYKNNKAQRDSLDKIVNRAGGPEAVFQAATGQTKAGATKIGAVLGALNPESANVVRATVLHRMGQAVPSAANPAAEFNASTLLTNWERMSAEAKDTLFGSFGSSGAGSDLRKSLDSITNTIGTLRNAGHTLANPSGSAGAGMHAYGLGKIMEGISMAAGGIAGGWHTLAGAAAAIPANMILSRAMVNPRTARWIATTTKLPKHAIPNAVNQLAKMGKTDPDARDLAAALQHGGAQ